MTPPDLSLLQTDPIGAVLPDLPVDRTGGVSPPVRRDRGGVRGLRRLLRTWIGRLAMADTRSGALDAAREAGVISPAASYDLDQAYGRRMLATVLFTDIVGSTERAGAMGDQAWLEVLDRHDRIVRDNIARLGGRVVKEMGDGVLAVFATPIRGVRCATEIRAAVRSLGLAVRVGLHVGEVETRGRDIGGIAVHITARILEQAGADEILVSRTLTDLVVGTDVDFCDRGEREMHGLSRRWWRLFAVV